MRSITPCSPKAATVRVKSASSMKRSRCRVVQRSLTGGSSSFDVRELRGIELQPDILVDVEDLVGSGGDPELQAPGRGPDGVVPVLAQVGALHDPPGHRGAGPGPARALAAQEQAL